MRAVGRKSRRRSNASELLIKNEAEKKRIEQQADIIALLRDELALHIDACVCDPPSVSRNDLLRMVLHHLTKERESYVPNRTCSPWLVSGQPMPSVLEAAQPLGKPLYESHHDSVTKTMD